MKNDDKFKIKSKIYNALFCDFIIMLMMNSCKSIMKILILKCSCIKKIIQNDDDIIFITLTFAHHFKFIILIYIVTKLSDFHAELLVIMKEEIIINASLIILSDSCILCNTRMMINFVYFTS